VSATAPLPVVVLISGSGTNLQSLIDAAPDIDIDIRAVFSDRADAHGLQRATAAHIPNHHIDPDSYSSRDDFDRELVRQIDAYHPELIVLAGFMRILSPPFVRQYAGRTLNIHPSLLPRYRGLHTHRRVLEAGDRLHGCSIHFVTDELDGGPLIAQAHVTVFPGDDEQTLSARVQEREHKLYPLVVEWIATGRLIVREAQACLDGEPLRTPVVYDQDEEIR